MDKIKVLFASSEVSPFIKVGGLADVVGALPVELNKNDVDARVILPLYKSIKMKYRDELKFLGWKMVHMGWRSLYAGLFSIEKNGTIFYFVDNEYYFNYDQVYVEYVFDIERYCFFQRAALDFIGDFMSFEPNILHCNDWQTGMMPMLLEAHFKRHGYHKDIKTVYTIHNLKYQGIHGTDVVSEMLDIPSEYLKEGLCIKDDAINFTNAGIVYSNSVTTVSPTYAFEIMTDYYGEGLNGILRRYAFKVSGILNGINDLEYRPSVDSSLPMKYDISNYEEDKAVCKKSLQEQLKLDINPDVPLCVMISRLVDQKGLDLLLYVLEEMLYDGMQIVILGTGDKYYEQALASVASKHPNSMCACIDFDNGLAHTIYAASDIFLMPSIFEPCGLSQLISMTYGSVPVVRETGGLKDSVIPYNEYTGEGNGFSFANINAHEFLFVTKYACDLYRHHKDVWKKLIEEGMSGDYSWKKSAREYIGLYSLISGITYEDSQPEIDKKSSVNPKILEIKTKELKNPTPSKIAAPPMAKPDSSKKKTSKVTRISKNKADSSAKVEKKEEKAVVDKKATANKPTPSKAAPKKESKKDNKRK
ncbi:MAG TPA: glycogen/starch synthase [Saccharofermentans sp.]|nr:glycogen/starch synthase [Saccharofermentans sp.]